MDTNKKILIGAIGAAVVIGGAAIGFILSQTPEKADLSTLHTEAPTQAEPETMEPTTEAATTEAPVTPDDAGTASSVTAGIETYTSGNISIQYPVIDKMEDGEKQEQINALLKANALSYIKANSIDETKDQLSVKCQVISADRKRLTATYKGTLKAEDPDRSRNVFYANTVNILQVQDLGLDDFSDAYTMAGYVLSDDVTFSGISADVEAQILKYRSTLDIDALSKVFGSADFPLDSETLWPESFSFEKQGTIYFSMPVPQDLGDYVLVSFDPSTK